MSGRKHGILLTNSRSSGSNSDDGKFLVWKPLRHVLRAVHEEASLTESRNSGSEPYSPICTLICKTLAARKAQADVANGNKKKAGKANIVLIVSV